MASSVLLCSTLPVDIYPRLRLGTLSLSRPSLIISVLKPANAPERTRPFPVHHHKHPPRPHSPPRPSPYTTLRRTNSSPICSRFSSGPSRDPKPTSTSTAEAPSALTSNMQRPATPYNDPKVQGPSAKILASGNHSDLRKMMNHTTVNKTGLHPSGVQYVSPLGLFGSTRANPSPIRPSQNRTEDEEHKHTELGTVLLPTGPAICCGGRNK